MNPQVVEFKELAEEQVTRRSESAEEVLGKDHGLVLRGGGDHLVPWSTSLYIRWKEAGQPVRF